MVIHVYWLLLWFEMCPNNLFKHYDPTNSEQIYCLAYLSKL